MTHPDPPDDVVRAVGGPHDLRGDEDDVEEVAQEEEAKRRKLTDGGHGFNTFQNSATKRILSHTYYSLKSCAYRDSRLFWRFQIK